jgi:molecular chaperone DnaJ
LRGKGFYKLNNYQKGDQIVTFKVKIPKNLTEKQKELLKQFDEEIQNSKNDDKSFFEKLKEKII